MKTLPRAALTALCLLVTAARPQEGEKERLRQALGDHELAGTWIYDDLAAGYAEGKKSGKPLLVVVRCVP
jgi:serine protease Do